MIAQENAFLAAEAEFGRMMEYAREAVRRGRPLHEVENDLWGFHLNLGRQMLQGYVDAQGDGDVGETLELADGRMAKRLEGLHGRPYKSVFGQIEIERCVYGTREKQKFEAVPLDARLELPAEETSYLLQDWDQSYCVEQSFERSSQAVDKILRFRQPVGTLEHMNRSLAETAAAYRESQPSPPTAEEGEVAVLMADCKGIPMCSGPVGPQSGPGEAGKKGAGHSRKRMACVGASYTVARFRRTAADVVNEVLRKEAQEQRPRPQHKRLRAELTRELDGEEVNGKDLVFDWLRTEAEQRNPDGQKEVVFLSDGEKALEESLHKHLEEKGIRLVSALDLMHALPRLWDAATCFHPADSDAAKEFVLVRLERLLKGEVDYVIRGLRQMATKHKLRGCKQKTIAEITQYYENNRHRMKYDEYLAAGYPIGTGPVEGACRHLVKDRLERSGMRWTVEGAQAMLDLRAIDLNDDWDEFHLFRIERETERLYPYREAIANAPCWN